MRCFTCSLVIPLLAVLALAAALVGCAGAKPEQPADAGGPRVDGYLQNLVGEWAIERSIRGKIVGNRMTAAPVLGGRFVQLHMQSTSAADPYEAIVLVGYDQARGEYVAHWCDSFGPGYSALGRGSRTGDRLELRFDYPIGPFFNTWAFDPATGVWTFTGESGSPDGTRKPFARDVITRRSVP